MIVLDQQHQQHQQPTMAVQDDLAALFAKNMTFNHGLPEPVQDEPNKIVYISSHYSPNAHMAAQPLPQSQPQSQPQNQAPDAARPASEPPSLEPGDLELLLRSHGVNPAALLRPQADLFRAADGAQRLRLAQLWSICPPERGAADGNPALAWSSTTFEQEEALARARLEQRQALQRQYSSLLDQLEQQINQRRRQQQQQQGPIPGPGPNHGAVGVRMDDDDEDMALDDSTASTSTTHDYSPSPPFPPAPAMQGGDGSWGRGLPPAYAHHYMEPYMQSGYEELARREYEASARRGEEEKNNNAAAGCYSPRTDPVYGGGGKAAADAAARGAGEQFDWEKAMMENNYGAVVAWREDEEML